jgi:hypothetical protein
VFGKELSNQIPININISTILFFFSFIISQIVKTGCIKTNESTNQQNYHTPDYSHHKGKEKKEKKEKKSRPPNRVFLSLKVYTENKQSFSTPHKIHRGRGPYG